MSSSVEGTRGNEELCFDTIEISEESIRKLDKILEELNKSG